MQLHTILKHATSFEKSPLPFTLFNTPSPLFVADFMLNRNGLPVSQRNWRQERERDLCRKTIDMIQTAVNEPYGSGSIEEGVTRA